jgi:hypothetical protein
MDYSNVIIAVCSVITTLLALKFWIFSGIDEKFQIIDKRFDLMDKRFDKIDQGISEIRKDVQNLESRVSHIEGYLMGRPWKDGTNT